MTIDVNRGNRIHIGFFGKVNSGKSTLINSITNEDVSIISNTPGTTTDVVYKNMELRSLGPVVLMDTAGFDDKSTLGNLRIKRTRDAIKKTDIFVVVISSSDVDLEKKFIKNLNSKKILVVINKIDILTKEEIAEIEKKLSDLKVKIVKNKKNSRDLIENLIKNLETFREDEQRKLFTGLVEKEDVVLLVTPQDMAAPKNRLILPQVQSIRELLDKEAIVIVVKLEEFKNALNILKSPPKLIVTDSQVFQEVYKDKPKDSMLTSFSVLFAKLKGDINSYIKGVNAFKNIDEKSKILIAECCSHAPVEEDIGTVKIPNMLRKKFGENLKIEFTKGATFPKNIKDYDLIIQCGGCMLNRKNIINRIESANVLDIPITNYGITIAYFKNILDKIIY